MRVQEFAEAHSFLDRIREFLFTDETAHSLLLSAVLALSRTHSNGSLTGRTLRFLALVNDQEQIIGAALRTPQSRWIFASSSSRATLLLMKEIAKSGPYKSVLYPTFVTDAKAGNALNLMIALRVKMIEPAPGLIRLAHQKILKN